MYQHIKHYTIELLPSKNTLSIFARIIFFCIMKKCFDVLTSISKYQKVYQHIKHYTIELLPSTNKLYKNIRANIDNEKCFDVLTSINKY